MNDIYSDITQEEKEVLLKVAKMFDGEITRMKNEKEALMKAPNIFKVKKVWDEGGNAELVDNNGITWKFKVGNQQGKYKGAPDFSVSLEGKYIKLDGHYGTTDPKWGNSLFPSKQGNGCTYKTIDGPTENKGGQGGSGGNYDSFGQTIGNANNVGAILTQVIIDNYLSYKDDYKLSEFVDQVFKVFGKMQEKTLQLSLDSREPKKVDPPEPEEQEPPEEK